MQDVLSIDVAFGDLRDPHSCTLARSLRDMLLVVGPEQSDFVDCTAPPIVQLCGR